MKAKRTDTSSLGGILREDLVQLIDRPTLDTANEERFRRRVLGLLPSTSSGPALVVEVEAHGRTAGREGLVLVRGEDFLRLLGSFERRDGPRGLSRQGVQPQVDAGKTLVILQRSPESLFRDIVR